MVTYRNIWLQCRYSRSSGSILFGHDYPPFVLRRDVDLVHRVLAFVVPTYLVVNLKIGHECLIMHREVLSL